MISGFKRINTDFFFQMAVLMLFKKKKKNLTYIWALAVKLHFYLQLCSHKESQANSLFTRRLFPQRRQPVQIFHFWKEANGEREGARTLGGPGSEGLDCARVTVLRSGRCEFPPAGWRREGKSPCPSARFLHSHDQNDNLKHFAYSNASSPYTTLPPGTFRGFMGETVYV